MKIGSHPQLLQIPVTWSHTEPSWQSHCSAQLGPYEPGSHPDGKKQPKTSVAFSLQALAGFEPNKPGQMLMNKYERAYVPF